MPGKKKYTDKQKIAYYKKKAEMAAKRKRKYVRGQGAYSIPKDFFSAEKLGGSLGGAGGAWIGNMMAPGIGAEVGSALGQMGGSHLGRLFKKITGWGDYTVKENSLLYEDAVVPSFGEDSIRVRKREFITGLNSVASTFTNHVFDINPGLDTTFPWLSSIARNYEQYRINGMIFQFVSTSSDAIASTTALGLGQVILATDYNSADEQFQDAPQMLNYMFSNSGKPSDNIMHAIECAPTDTAQKLFYVRTGNVKEGQDPRLYDLGKFQIAVNNMPASYDGMGQLWVSYDITFCKSCQNNQLGWALNSDYYLNLASEATVGTINNANPLGTSTTPTGTTPEAGSNFGIELNANTIFFPEDVQSGYYRIFIQWSGTSVGSWTRPTFTPLNCGLVLDNPTTGVGYRSQPANGSAAAQPMVEFIVKLGTTNNTDQCQLVLTGATLPTSMIFVIVQVDQVNGDIYDAFAVQTSAWS